MIASMCCRRWVACAALLSAALAAPEVVARAPSSEVTITDRARAHFQAGVNYLQDPDGARYEEAYREFKAAYAEAPSWKILGNLGIAAMKLERDGEAIEAFEKYLQEGGEQLDAAERAQFERDLQTLRASLVTLTVESLPPGAVLVDERTTAQAQRIVNQYGPLTQAITMGIRPGQHRLTARLAGYQDATWDLDARPGTAVTHRFELQPVAPAPAAAPVAAPPATPGPSTEAAMVDVGKSPRPVPLGVYVGAAATGALALGAGVVGVMALGKHSDYDEAIEQGDRAAAEDAKDSGETLNLVTDVLWGAAAVSAGVTAVLYFTRPSQPPQSGVASLELRPAVAPGAAALSIRGSF